MGESLARELPLLMSPMLKARHPPVLIPLDVKLALERLKLAELVRQQAMLPFPSPVPRSKALDSFCLRDP